MMIIDFSLEALDFIQRVYQAEESIKIIGQMISQRIFASLIVIQLVMGMFLPLIAIAAVKIFRFPGELRRLIYFVSAILVQVGIFATRWNVVIGGQLFSKSFRGLTTYKIGIGGAEGLLVSLAFLVLPFIVLYALIKILPPWEEDATHRRATAAN
jgi:Ni/Fe-hydrogenase subunit HybB-like protein